MITFALVFAACWGVLQVAALGSMGRSTSVGLHLLSLGTGVYFCGPLALLLQLAYTRTVAAITGGELYDVVKTASYTVDPVIEELVKVVPLVLVALHARTRLQWGLTDYVLIGAGAGAGFGLLEAVMRFGDRAGAAISAAGGWIFPSLAPPYIASPGAALLEWLPAPVSNSDLFDLGSTEPFQHLIWSALAGLGVGLLLRTGGRLRLLGLVPIVLVCLDHAAYNFDVGVPDAGLLGLWAAPFLLAEPLRGWWPLFALALATVLDRRVLARGAAAAPGLAGPVLGAGDLWRYARLRPPWSTAVAWSFVRRRRAVLFEAGAGVVHPDTIAALRATADDVAASAASERWAGVEPRRILAVAQPAGPGAGAWLRRYWQLGLWLLLLLPVVLYYGIGTIPVVGGLQDLLEEGTVPVAAVLLVVGLAWLAWQTVAVVRAVAPARLSDDGGVLGRVGLRLALSTGVLTGGLLCLLAWLTGVAGDRALVSNFHVLDALGDLLLYGGIALLLASFFLFPPFGLMVTTAGTLVLVPSLTTGFVVTSALGLSGILLAQAVGPGGGGGSGGGSSGGGSSGVPDIPRQPPRPKPQVRHHKLRNIVDNLWHGYRSPNRVGDGTTMSAVRNEIRTGRPTGGRFHSQKARESIAALQRWLRDSGPSATRSDRQWAHQLISDLQQALK
jgi:hypothetical protein